jgi:uncharacterized iron-regulated membrane protein
MDLTALPELIGSIGFPAVCVIGMAWFIYQVFQKTTTQSQENMKQLQENCQKREDKLYEEIKENREVNAQAIATIALYADKLTTIQNDVSEIKTDMAVLMNNHN